MCLYQPRGLTALTALTVNYSAMAHAVCRFCNKRCPSSPYGTITQHPKPFPSIPETSMSDPPHPSPSSPSDRTEAYDKKEETGRFPIHQSIHHQTHIRSFVMRTRTHKNNTISLLFFFLHEEKIPSEEIQLISSTHHQATNGIMRIRTIKNGPPYPSIRLIPVFRITVQIP